MEKKTTTEDFYWYAASTRSRHEKVAASMLESLGVRHFLPLITQARRWSDRERVVASPLFTCYVFINIANEPESRLRVLKVPGGIGLVGNQNGPAAIPEGEIESLRAVLSQGIGCVPCPYLQKGDRVRIVRGALTGIEGMFLRSGRDSKLVLSIEMIQRSVAINIDACDVEPVSQSPYGPSAKSGFSVAHVA